MRRYRTDLLTHNQALVFQHLQSAAERAWIDTSQLLLQFTETLVAGIQKAMNDLERPLSSNDASGCFYWAGQLIRKNDWMGWLAHPAEPLPRSTAIDLLALA